MDKINHIIALAMVVSWILVLVLYKYITSLKKYMKEFIEASKKVKNMDFGVRLNMSHQQDFNVFAKDFNDMTKMLETSFSEVEDKNIQLNSILRSVSNGILVLDVYDKVYLINDRAKKYLDCENEKKVETMYVDDVIKDTKILKFVKRNIGTEKSRTKEIRFKNGKIYKVKLDPIMSETKRKMKISLVINIEDVTERIKLENMRRDFAANVSHELKTPLTSIQGFVETLKENDEAIDPKVRRRFLDIIENESDRLTVLINDILLLSSIEGGEELHLEWVDLDQASKNLEHLLSKKAIKAGVELRFKNKVSKGEILTQKQYFKELLINLITNGIKYNKVGGKVEVEYSEDEKNIIVKVEDTGIGISEDEKERIFERFYRVTKSRNKEIEGTGLGLAIIKHIAISLNGSIELESKLGEGSTFKIILPKNNNSVSLGQNKV